MNRLRDLVNLVQPVSMTVEVVYRERGGIKEGDGHLRAPGRLSPAVAYRWAWERWGGVRRRAACCASTNDFQLHRPSRFSESVCAQHAAHLQTISSPFWARRWTRIDPQTELPTSP